jgi:hypothetical protein
MAATPPPAVIPPPSATATINSTAADPANTSCQGGERGNCQPDLDSASQKIQLIHIL